MLTSPFSPQAGYTILEALVAAAMTSLVTIGVWQVVRSSSLLAGARFSDSQPLCDVPECSAHPTRIVCSCGHLQYVIIR